MYKAIAYYSVVIAGSLLPPLCLVIVGFLGCEARLAIIALSLAMGFQGLTAAGFYFNQIDIAQPFAGSLCR